MNYREFDIDGLLLAKYQGKIFEKSVDRFDCSSKIFLRRFYHSKLISILDEGEAGLVDLNADKALDSIEEEFGETHYGKEKYSKESLYWLGYLYRYISYTRRINSQLLMKTFPYEKIVNLYSTLKNVDIESCINYLLNNFNLDKDFFDPNYRFKLAYQKQKNSNNIKN